MEAKLLRLARERLNRRREEHAALRARREAEVCRRVPEIGETDAALRELMGEVVSAAARHAPRPVIEEIGQRSKALCRQKAALLKAHGYPEDYLDEIIDCPICRDAGYLRDGSMCTCLKKLWNEEQERVNAAAAKLGEECFADFDLSYYDGAAREYMELALANSRRFAETFGPQSPNLLFQGGTGLGKSFLSRCVAKAVSARGFSVCSETAQGAFAAYETQKFSRDPETWAAATETVGRILRSDLLILDDLGTELTTAFTQSALYNILETRLTAGKKMIFTTNLSDKELEERYIPQTVSRISGEFDVLTFRGRDIRAIRKERRYL